MCRTTPGWHIKIMIQEIANPTPALSTVVDHVIRPQYNQLCELIGGIIRRPGADRVTRLCVHSLIGQVTHYAHGRAVIGHLWPELEMTVDSAMKSRTISCSSHYPVSLWLTETRGFENERTANPRQAARSCQDRAGAPAAQRFPIVLAPPVLGVTGYFWWKRFVAPPPIPNNLVLLSGRIEGDDSAVASKTSGRVLRDTFSRRRPGQSRRHYRDHRR